MNKIVRNRVEKKRINVRIEHVRPSKCRTDFLARAKAVDAKKREAKAAGIRLPIEEIKRFPTGPKGAYSVSAENVMTLKPVAYDDMM
jgi:large subunit ribosomal protein L21e